MASLNVSLDDAIKSGRYSNRGSVRRSLRRSRGPRASSGGRGIFGAPHRNLLGINDRPTVYSISKPVRRTKDIPWHNCLTVDGLKAAGLLGLEIGTKLYISNLDSGVTSEDIRELFSEIGKLMQYAIHYDKSGHPSGSAEVIFARRSDAFQALKRYNNVQLDGKPMKIEIIGTSDLPPVSSRINVVGERTGKRTIVMSKSTHLRDGSAAANRGNTQKGRGRGGAKWRKTRVNKSAEELDKELDNYHAEAMQS